jgi:peptidoglycan/xylan/chitin deacetylase (PgdA/CDA1 family)
MDRRGFLRSAALLAGGTVVGGTMSRIGSAEAGDPQSARAALVDRAFANERGGAALRSTQVVWKVDTDEKVLALTFDDGPSSRWTGRMLDVLDDRKAPATFNLVGREALSYAPLVRREMAARHQIENHTWSHADLAFASAKDADFQIRRGAEVIESLTGRRPQYFRPPRGDLSGTALAAAARTEADILLWSLQLHERTMDTDENVDFVLERLTPGTILLAHDAGGPHRNVGLRALPRIIDGARARGYELVTVSDLVAAGRPTAGSPPTMTREQRPAPLVP